MTTFTVWNSAPGQWKASCSQLDAHGVLTRWTRISHSPFDALRQLLQVDALHKLNQLEEELKLWPLEAKIEEGEA